MKYFRILEKRQCGEQGFRLLMGSEMAFTNFYGAIPPAAQEVFQGVDFFGAPPPESCLWVMPRDLLNVVVMSPDGEPAPTTPWS